MTISSVMREPYTTRLQMSRPSSSVPIQFSPLGGLNLSDRLCAVGECVAIHGANSANNIRSRTIAAPATASGLESSAR
jgi:hypothetical protein